MTEHFGIFSAGWGGDTDAIEATGTAHTITGGNKIVKAQLTYRGLPFQTTAYKAIETQQEATFRGRKANVISPVKSPTILPPDIQFFGRHAAGTSAAATANFTVNELMMA